MRPNVQEVAIKMTPEQLVGLADRLREIADGPLAEASISVRGAYLSHYGVTPDVMIRVTFRSKS